MGPANATVPIDIVLSFFCPPTQTTVTTLLAMSGHKSSTERTALTVSSSFHQVEALRRPSSLARDCMGKFCLFFRVSREITHYIRDNKSQWNPPKSTEYYTEQGARGILNVI